jgi:hypothetical protein
MSRKWHPRCFVCGFCDTAINQVRCGGIHLLHDLLLLMLPGVSITQSEDLSRVMNRGVDTASLPQGT